MRFSLSLEHYKDDKGGTTDRRRIQPKGRESYGKIRHKVAEIIKDFYLDVRPVDAALDPARAEVAKWVLESETSNPYKGYKTVRKQVVMGALSSRMWCAALDWHPHIRPYGEIVPRPLPPWSLYWTPGWYSPHDPSCPWVLEVMRMRCADVRAMKSQGWKNVDEIRSDPEDGSVIKSGDPSLPAGQVRMGGDEGNPHSQPYRAEGYCTVLKCWYRFPDDAKDSKSGERVLLDPSRRYMACMNEECGYHERDIERDGDVLPESGAPCPKCGQDMDRIDAEVPTDKTLSYPAGKLVIVPAYGDEEFYNDKWPFELRSVPYMVYRAYDHPLEVMGMSDTALDRSLQLISDATLRLGYEQMSQNVDLIIAPWEGLVDAQRRPWQFSDVQGRVAFWDAQGPPSVQHFQGSSIPNGWTQWFGAIQNSLTKDMGTGDIAIGAQQSKDIAVGTIQAMQQTGEIPVQQHMRDLWMAEAPFLGVWLDMWRATTPVERYIRYHNEQGATEFALLKGADVPGADVMVQSEPAQASVHPEEITALQMVLNAPPPQRKILAKKVNLSQSDLQQYEQDEEAFMQKQQAQMQQMQQGMAGGGLGPLGMAGATDGGNGVRPPAQNGIMQQMQR